MQNPPGMFKEIRAIEISRAGLSVGSTYTESVALQSFFSKRRVHPLKQKPRWLYVGCLLYGMSDSCRQRQWVSELLQPGEETRVVCAWSVSRTGASSQSEPENNLSSGHRKTVVWSSMMERCSWACCCITSLLTPQSKASAHFLMIFKKTDVM